MPQANSTIPPRLTELLGDCLASYQIEQTWLMAEQMKPLSGQKILFIISLDEQGLNYEYYRFLAKIRGNSNLFKDCLAALIIDGQSELYTKSIGRELVLAANQAGCAFIGRPLVEATLSLNNFEVQAEFSGFSLFASYQTAVNNLLKRLFIKQPPYCAASSDLLVIHAAAHAKSNTHALWSMVKSHLDGLTIKEIGLRNGSMVDCSGCPYTMCLHYGERSDCYYGGIITTDCYPALEKSKALLLLCPNYNDALSANLTAFINRLTALYRRQPFFSKAVFALIVSGYSGSDILAGQIISGLCMNKSFFLPPNFCLMQTANYPGSINTIADIEKQAALFGQQIREIYK